MANRCQLKKQSIHGGWQGVHVGWAGEMLPALPQFD